jgi:hypothetical protein
VVRLGILALLAGAVILMAALDADAGAEIVTVPLLLIGLGMGALASQLGSVTVSAVPDKQSAEVGGIQNAVTNLGASIGTALAGSILIAALTASFLTSVEQNEAIPADVKSQAGGTPRLAPPRAVPATLRLTSRTNGRTLCAAPGRDRPESKRLRTAGRRCAHHRTGDAHQVRTACARTPLGCALPGDRCGQYAR